MKKCTHFASMLLIALFLFGANGYASEWLTSQQHTADANFSFRTGEHEWNVYGKSKATDRARRAPMATTDEKIGPCQNFGTLNGPDGTTWTYTISIEQSGGTYTSATVTIYDSENKKQGTIQDVFELGENETGVNSVEVNPLITKSFFNTSSSDYEIMLFIHATTEDYSGHSYNDVFSISTGQKICQIDGNQVLAINTAADKWSEVYTLVFMRETFEGDDQEDYHILFDIYNKASYSSKTPVLAHTFDVDYKYIAGSGNEALPILMNKCGNKVYFALAQYEQPYFDPSIPVDQEPVVTPDNSLVITLYDNTFTEQAVTKIPVPDKGEYLYVFPILGGLRYHEDLTFGLFSEGTEPAYVITYDYYTSEDDFVRSFYVHNVNGERIATIAEGTDANLYMSDLPGYEEQWCFLQSNDEESWLAFVDFPSCKEVAKIPTFLGDRSLSKDLDRCIAGDSYQYVISLLQGYSDSEGNTIHSLAWFDANGEFSHEERLNLGQNIMMAQVYMDQKAFDPWLFNTDDTREYMVLVKRQQSSGSTATDEILYIVNTKGEILAEFGPDEEKGGNLLVISLYNTDTHPTLLIVYSKNWQYTLNMTDLPLTKFAAGGNGTAANPYKIATAGDFRQIKTAPSAYYEVVNDIDFMQIPYSSMDETFKGSLDGKGHAFVNLQLADGGLFENVANATIKDIQLYHPVLTIESDNAKGFVADIVIGGMTDTSTPTPTILENIHLYRPEIKGSSDNSIDLGGIVGRASVHTYLQQCSVNDAQFNLPKASIGGIAGLIQTGSTISACSFSGNITAATAGGITASSNNGDETISHCHVNANITANNAGGIIGYNERSTITNCYVEGTLALPADSEEGAIGGIVGLLTTNYEKDEKGNYTNTNIVIENCIVGLSAISIPETATEAYAHRIVGFSSIDDKEIDWDNTKDYNNPVYLESLPEAWIKDNYALSHLAVIDEAIEAANTTTEGATLAAADFTSDFFTEHGFKAGNTKDAPWVYDANPYLWYEKEAGALTVDRKEATLSVGETLTVVFTIINGDAEQIEIETPTSFIEITGTEVAGDQVYVTIQALGEGIANLTAKYGEKTATCTINCVNETAVENVQAASLRLSYNGTEVTADEAEISIYSISGALVRQGRSMVSTNGLNSGIYIAYARSNAGSATLKIAIQ